jgi:glucan-binding YG repeat protein
MSPPPATKKQKLQDRDATEARTAANASLRKGGNPERTTTTSTNVLTSFEPLTLEDIQSRIQSLCERIPAIPDAGGGPVKKEATSPQQPGATTDNDDNDNDDNDTRPGNNKNKTTNKNNVSDDDHHQRMNETRVIFRFATQLQIVLEEFELLSCCINMATYQWGTERSGAADQNLSLLKGEWNSTMQQISSMVSPSLHYLLNPDVELVVEKTTVSTTTTTTTTTPQPQQQQQQLNHKNHNHHHKNHNNNNNDQEEEEQSRTTLQEETRQNHYTHKVVNTGYVQFCHDSVARNAPLLRHVVLSNFHKLIKAIQDYVQAQKSDSPASRDFSY